MDFERLTRAELIKITGFSGTAIDGWVRGGCPRRSDGTFRFKEVLRWFVARSKANASSPGLERLRLSQAKRSELKAAVERGEVAPITATAKLWEAQIMACRAKLLALPNTVAPEVIGCGSIAEVSELLRKRIYDALAELADPAFVDEVFRKTFPSSSACGRRGRR